MGSTAVSIRATVLEQTERTRQCSRADIEESESKIISLNLQISSLIELRDSQHACVLALRHIIAPIRTLPVEVLAEIFELTIEDDTHIEDVHCISQVCSDWRLVAHDTPQLWARPLMIDLCNKMDVAGGLKTWLARSAPMPVRMSFARIDMPINGAILEEVLAVAPRSSSLQFPTVYSPPFSLVRQLAQARLDSLEDLSLGSMDCDWLDLSFTAVPRLRKLDISNCLTTHRTLVPWAQLTDLTVGHSTPEVILEILSQCPNLLTVSVFAPGWGRLAGLSEANQDIVVLSHLRTLTLSFVVPSRPITSFFDYLSAPVLRDLRLWFTRAPWSQAHFLAFQLWAQNITRLELSSRESLTSDDLGAVILHASSLTHLQFSYCNRCLNDAFIRTLYYDEGVTPLVPHLHSLVVKTETMRFSEDVLAGMIASRWWTDTELASLEVLPVARWSSVELEFRLYHTLRDSFADVLKNIPPDVLAIKIDYEL